MELSIRHLLLPSSWKWMTVMACYLVLLHLFPATLIPGRSIVSSTALSMVPVLITYVAILAVSIRLGWKAREPLMAEAAIAGILYFALFNATSRVTDALPVDWKFTSRLYALYLWPVVIGYAGAAVGMLLRQLSLRPEEAPHVD